MIENERQKQTALAEIAYLKSQTGQSWLGGERMRQRIGRLRDQIDDYDRRQSAATQQEAADTT